MSRSQDALVTGAPVTTLVPYGLSPDADLVYRTLVTFGAATGPDLERGLGMPYRRIRAGLDELAATGAVTSRPTARWRDIVWTPRPPDEVVAAQRRARLRLVRSGRQEAREPLPLGDDLRHLPSRAAARDRLTQLVAVVRHEHLAMNTEEDFDTESARSAAPLDRKLVARGVRVRVLGVHPAERAWIGGPWRQPDGNRPDYREAPVVPMKLIVVDRAVALFPVAPDDFDRGYLEVAQPPVVSALVTLFERHWDAARPPQEHALPDFALDPRERALVDLLAQGHTDATAADELRISARSVSYILRGLMDRLGVENRFQLGLALGAMKAAEVPEEPQKPVPPPEEPREPEEHTP
ncbi:helix-turn-helix transcriptional regulator [Phytohabitans rumicis]|uniref:Transcriptional regulator n=1 Tax=Phytohabitans rumicis TaxID=1076125 RepID=A0A6V8LLE0_9ACTN|nr:LuxR family transcriptional regulator [Phytohabitans rumicis]GFJ95791.1 transcriptional regulator [Phytohabitans rumicis]